MLLKLEKMMKLLLGVLCVIITSNYFAQESANTSELKGKSFTFYITGLSTEEESKAIETTFMSKSGFLSCDANPNTHQLDVRMEVFMEDWLVQDVLNFLNIQIIQPIEFIKYY